MVAMARKEKRDDLILYMGILKSGTVLASFSNKDSSLDKIVLEASTEVPELCRTYSMGFNQIMIIFLRDSDEPDVLYVMGCHAVLSKSEAQKLLEELRHLHMKPRPKRHLFRKISEDEHSARKRMEQKMRTMIANKKGNVPPTEVLSLYEDAPDAYYVQKKSNPAPLSDEEVENLKIQWPPKIFPFTLGGSDPSKQDLPPVSSNSA